MTSGELHLGFVSTGAAASARSRRIGSTCGCRRVVVSAPRRSTNGVARLRAAMEDDAEALSDREHHASSNNEKMDGGGSSSLDPSSTSNSNADDDVLSNRDWRAFRARLVAAEASSKLSAGAASAISGPEPSVYAQTHMKDTSRWAHIVSNVERGCLLVAAPVGFQGSQAYFEQSVIVIIEHNEAGTVGFILNRPLTYSLSGSGFQFCGELAHSLKSNFENSALYFGGDCGGTTLSLIHPYRNLQGAVEVVDGVWAGGLHSLIAARERGEVDLSKVRFFSGYCGWAPGQLEREIENGVWFLAASSANVVTAQCLNLKRPLWRQVLDMLGGSYAQIARQFDLMDAADQ
eukprot:CAMPEP_0185844386 /NCGR_PEP_ID=MMETSP1354-20130828/573_1 /TAXON_ID=708628 /ORGANISM="Erythrolobus madagascarensis, Strain CCMP3276" /LENGTH=346 /DNA_ID=CAMNT_0028544041 /DNA_START=113 /DNA_END=1153 /DNA_ORIENTATION=-